jgi:hypothetical protein
MAKPQDFTIVFAGAGSQEVHARGKFLRVLAAPVADIFLKLDSSKEMQRGEGAEVADSDPKGFTKVTVRSAVAQTVRFSVSELPQADNRQTVTVNASATVQGATVITADPLVEVGAGLTVQLAAGDPDRIELRLALASDEPGPVWIGPAGVGDEEGGLLEPGMVDYPATTAAVFAHNPHATLSVFVSVLDMTAP